MSYSGWLTLPLLASSASISPSEMLTLLAVSRSRRRAEPQSPAVFDDWAERFGVDAANVPNGLRLADFRLLAIDMDSTLVTMETLDEIADMAGLKAEVAAITEAAMRGEIKDFSESLTRRMALLKGVGEDLIERVYQERLHLSPGAEILLAAAKAAGLKTMLISGGFTHFTERLKARLGFDYAFANQFASGGSSNLLQLRNNFTEECKNTAEETELLIALRRCAGLNSLLGGSRRCHFFCPFLSLKKYARGTGVRRCY